MIYDFFCPKCNTEFEKDIAITNYDEEKAKTVCPKCGQKAMRKFSVYIDRPSGDGRGFYGLSQ